jgi:hypothetical protein
MVKVLFYCCAAVSGLIGALEAPEALAQYLMYVVVNLNWPRSITDIAHMNSPCIIFAVFGFHGLPSAQASPLFLAIAVVCVGIGEAAGAIEEAVEKRASRLAADRRQQEEAAARAQSALEAERARMEALSNESSALLKSLPAFIERADADLDRAETEFSGNYLDPFWDAVQDAVTQLASFDNSLRQLNSNAEEFLRSARILGSSAIFPVRGGSIPDSAPVSERLHKIVRRAQKEVSFSQIFHLRKTNQILVSGFSTLGRAIIDLRRGLEVSLSDLASSLGVTLSEIVSVQATAASEQREMLDNLQRRKFPSVASQRDRDY